MAKEDEICSNANKNPVCPYVTDIRASKEDRILMKRALVGDDLQGGLVKRMTDVEAELKEVKAAVKRRWNFKDTGTLLLGLAALITAIWALWPKG
jgi:hypothetical protein